MHTVFVEREMKIGADEAWMILSQVLAGLETHAQTGEIVSRGSALAAAA